MTATQTLEFRWTTSRARDSYGYNVCTLYVDGCKVASCNGGGYDMQGTCLGIWVEREYADRLRKLRPAKIRKQNQGRGFYGLTFHDPDFDPGKAKLPSGKTVAQAEADGDSMGLDRYQQFHKASSIVPSKRHHVPQIEGGCGISCVQTIMGAIGLKMQYVPTSKRDDSLYILTDKRSR